MTTNDQPHAPVKCARCGRALTAAKSTARALGPVCARKAKAAGVEAPATAAAVVAIAAGKVRRSAAVAGLTYETATRDGVLYLTFRFGAAFETVAIQDGQVLTLDCSDRAVMPGRAAAACIDFTRALAARLAGKVVA